MLVREHDSAGRILRETVNGLAVETDFDRAGNVLSKTWPGGRSLTFEQEQGPSGPLARLDRILDHDGSLIADHDWLGASRLARLTLGNGVVATVQHDAVGRPMELLHEADGSPLSHLAWDWDAVGNRIAEHDLLENLHRTFEIDSFDRMITSGVQVGDGPVLSRSYDFDGAQNRLSVQVGSYVQHYTMDATPDGSGGPADYQVNQYTQGPQGEHLHDARGNLVALDGATDRTYVFDHANRLVRATVGGQVAVELEHDVLGRITTRRLVTPEGTTETRHVHDGWRVVEERDDTGAVLATHVHGAWIDQLLTSTRDDLRQWYVTDDQATVRLVLKDDASLLERYELQDFGEPLILSPSGAVLAESAVGNTTLFQGRPFDFETGLYDFRTRWLDPRDGRFLSRDTLGVWGDEGNFGNGLAFAGNNPRRFVDPTGQDANDVANWADARLEAGVAFLHSNLQSGTFATPLLDAAVAGQWFASGTIDMLRVGVAVGDVAGQDTGRNRDWYDYVSAGAVDFSRGTNIATSVLGAGSVLKGGVTRVRGAGASRPPGLAAGDAPQATPVAKPAAPATSEVTAAPQAVAADTGAVGARVTSSSTPVGAGSAAAGDASLGASTPAGKYTVGAYDDIRGTAPGLDAHHVGQKAVMEDFIPEYDPATAPAILVPKVGHTMRGPSGIVSRCTEGFGSARDVIARDIRELRRVYPDIPNAQLQDLIQMNKTLYPVVNK